MIRIFLAVILFSGAASAQTVSECDWRASDENIPLPHDQYTREFSNGKVQVSLIDTEEPANAAMHLMITSPPNDAAGKPQCRIISRNGSLGFAGILFKEMTAEYDPAIGLTMHVPFVIYLPDQDFTNFAMLSVTLNQATGEIFVSDPKYSQIDE